MVGAPRRRANSLPLGGFGLRGVIKARSMPSDFAERLIAAREQAELTQAEAARRAKMSYQQWWDYESGRKTPTIPQAERLAAAVGATLAEILQSR